MAVEVDERARRREKQIGGSRGSLEPPGPLLEPPGPLLTHLHTDYMAYSERLLTRLNPMAERICFSQARRLCSTRRGPGHLPDRRQLGRERQPLALHELVEAYGYTRVRCHSSLEYVAYIGILHIKENGEGE